MIKFYLICFKKVGKQKLLFFICTQKRRNEFENPSVFHGIGFFYNGEINDINKIDNYTEREVWIPWDKISYVESFVYKRKKVIKGK